MLWLLEQQLDDPLLLRKRLFDGCEFCGAFCGTDRLRGESVYEFF